MDTTLHQVQLGIRHELAGAGKKRRDARDLRTEARESLKASIPKAVATGIPITEIAVLSAMTRRSVYDLLEEVNGR
jgi:hypothetical protein